MTKYSLKKISTQQIVFVWYGEAPTEPHLAAFRNASDPDWELVEEETPYEEHHLWTIMKRKDAYPELTELANALVDFYKGDKETLKIYLKNCEAVKLQFPKPTQSGVSVVPTPFQWSGYFKAFKSWLGLGG